MNINLILPDTDVTSIDHEQFMDYIGHERIELLEYASSDMCERVVVDCQVLYRIWSSDLSPLADTIFKLTIEYLLIFTDVPTLDAYFEFIAYTMDVDELTNEQKQTVVKLHEDAKKMLAEQIQGTCMPYHWLNNDRLLILKGK